MNFPSPTSNSAQLSSTLLVILKAQIEPARISPRYDSNCDTLPLVRLALISSWVLFSLIGAHSKTNPDASSASSSATPTAVAAPSASNAQAAGPGPLIEPEADHVGGVIVRAPGSDSVYIADEDGWHGENMQVQFSMRPGDRRIIQWIMPDLWSEVWGGDNGEWLSGGSQNQGPMLGVAVQVDWASGTEPMINIF